MTEKNFTDAWDPLLASLTMPDWHCATADHLKG